MCSKSQKGQNPTLKASIPDQLMTIIPWVFERGRKFCSSGFTVFIKGIENRKFFFYFFNVKSSFSEKAKKIEKNPPHRFDV